MNKNLLSVCTCCIRAVSLIVSDRSLRGKSGSITWSTEPDYALLNEQFYFSNSTPVTKATAALSLGILLIQNGVSRA